MACRGVGAWLAVRLHRMVTHRRGAMIDAEPEAPPVQAYEVSIPGEELGRSHGVAFRRSAERLAGATFRQAGRSSVAMRMIFQSIQHWGALTA